MNANKKQILLKEFTDEELMGKVAAGDLDKARFLFERYNAYVYNFLYKMSGDSTLSEDIAQEVFYKMMKYRSSYNNGKFVSWLFTIARNSLASHYSREKETHVGLDGIAYRLEEKEAPKNEEYSHLQKAMNLLEKSDRELLILNRFQEIKYNELAEIVGSTPGAVKVKVNRALKKLKVIYLKNI